MREGKDRAVDGGILGAIESVGGGGKVGQGLSSRESPPKGLDGSVRTVGVGFLVCAEGAAGMRQGG